MNEPCDKMKWSEIFSIMFSNKAFKKWAHQHSTDLKLLRGESSLDHCPICLYSLNRLPTTYKCPECAFEYDEHTRAWEGPVISRWNLLPLPIWISLIWLLAGIRPLGSAANKQWIMCALVTGIGVWGGVFLWHRTKYPRLFAVNERGIWIRRYLSGTRLFTWDQAATLDWTRIFGDGKKFRDAYYTMHGNPGVIREGIGFAIQSIEERQTVRKAIESGLARYHQHSKTHDS